MAVQHLNEYFGTGDSGLLKRKTYFEAHQQPNKTTHEFACPLWRLPQDCKFGDVMMIMLRDVFVNGVGERLLAEDARIRTSDALVAKSEACERAQAERGSVSQTTAIFVSVLKLSAAAPASITQSHTTQSTPALQPPRRKSSAPHSFHCGGAGHLATFAVCPARTAMCEFVGRKDTLLACHSALVHSDGRPEVHAVNVELHETTFTRGPQCFLWYNLLM